MGHPAKADGSYFRLFTLEGCPKLGGFSMGPSISQARNLSDSDGESRKLIQNGRPLKSASTEHPKVFAAG
jgi:hypothetical protein